MHLIRDFEGTGLFVRDGRDMNLVPAPAPPAVLRQQPQPRRKMKPSARYLYPDGGGGGAAFLAPGGGRSRVAPNALVTVPKLKPLKKVMSMPLF